jgi:hypothetical protein
MSTMTAPIKRETILPATQKSSDKSQPCDIKTSRENQEWSELMKILATLAHRTYRKCSVVVIELPLPHDY